MTNEHRERYKALVRSREDLEKSHEVPDTPQTRSPVYRLAFDDKDFLTSEALRPVRLQLELPIHSLQMVPVRSTVAAPLR